VIENVQPIGTTPIFRYYAYTGTPARPSLELATPLSASDLSSVALIAVGFSARGRNAGVFSQYRNEIFNRSDTCL
jgi:hypothetical protein